MDQDSNNPWLFTPPSPNPNGDEDYRDVGPVVQTHQTAGYFHLTNAGSDNVAPPLAAEPFAPSNPSSWTSYVGWASQDETPRALSSIQRNVLTPQGVEHSQSSNTGPGSSNPWPAPVVQSGRPGARLLQNVGWGRQDETNRAVRSILGTVQKRQGQAFAFNTDGNSVEELSENIPPPSAPTRRLKSSRKRTKRIERASKNKKKRVPFEPWQLEKMEEKFRISRHVERIEKQDLAETIDRTEEAIKAWFSYRRKKENERLETSSSDLGYDSASSLENQLFNDS